MRKIRVFLRSFVGKNQRPGVVAREGYGGSKAVFKKGKIIG